MTLGEYLRNNRISLAVFGQRAGISPSHLSRLATGRTRPSLAAIEAIYRASCGKVAAADWMRDVELVNGGPASEKPTWTP